MSDTKTPAPDVAREDDGGRPLPFDRDQLGRFVREAWVRWAQTQPNPKPSWLVSYDELDEPDKEADRQIGEAIARWTLIGDAARAALAPGGEREGDGWRPIETAPKDGTAILAVIGLYRRDQSFSHWDIHIIAFDQDRGAISPDHDQGWDWEDYEGWQPLPAPPLAPQEAGR